MQLCHAAIHTICHEVPSSYDSMILKKPIDLEAPVGNRKEDAPVGVSWYFFSCYFSCLLNVGLHMLLSVCENEFSYIAKCADRLVSCFLMARVCSS